MGIFPKSGNRPAMHHPLLCMPDMNLTRHTNISMAYHFNMPSLGLALVLGYRLAPSPCPSTSSPLPRPLRRWRLLGSATASPPCLHHAPSGGLLPGRFPGNPHVQAATHSHHAGIHYFPPMHFPKSGNSGNSGNMKPPTLRKPAPVLVLLLSKA